jgi:hypothetical protein
MVSWFSSVISALLRGSPRRSLAMLLGVSFRWTTWTAYPLVPEASSGWALPPGCRSGCRPTLVGKLVMLVRFTPESDLGGPTGLPENSDAASRNSAGGRFRTVSGEAPGKQARSKPERGPEMVRRREDDLRPWLQCTWPGSLVAIGLPERCSAVRGTIVDSCDGLEDLTRLDAMGCLSGRAGSNG